MKNVATFSNVRKRYLLGGPIAGVLLLSSAFAFGAGSASAAPRIGLGAAARFAVLAGTSVQGTQPALVRGDVGLLTGLGATTSGATNTATTSGSGSGLGLGAVLNLGAGLGLNLGGTSPATGAGTGLDVGASVIAGLHALLGGAVTGTIDAGNPTSTAAGQAAASAYNQLSLVHAKALVNAQLGGRTLTPGAYITPVAAKLNGALTLNAKGNPNALFIIKSPSSLTAAAGSSILLKDGAKAANVFLQVPADVNIGAGAHLVGNVLTGGSAQLGAGSSLVGSVLAPLGAVALNANTVSVPSLTTPVSAAVSPVVSTATTVTAPATSAAATVTAPITSAATTPSVPSINVPLPVLTSGGLSAVTGSIPTVTVPSTSVTLPSVSVPSVSIPQIAGSSSTGTTTSPNGSIITSRSTGSTGTSTSSSPHATGSSSSTTSASGSTAKASGGSTIPSGAPQTGFGGMAGEVLVPLGALLALGLAALAALMAVRSRRHATKHAASVTRV